MKLLFPRGLDKASFLRDYWQQRPLQRSVGPHIDDYDVFLLQAAGKRRWQIHTRPVSEKDYIPGNEGHLFFPDD